MIQNLRMMFKTLLILVKINGDYEVVLKIKIMRLVKLLLLSVA